MRLLSVSEMREMEDRANAAGYSYEAMMQAAGEGIASHIHQNHRRGDRDFVIGLVGGGNNGGDTLVALKTLQAMGWITRAVLIKERALKDPLLQPFLESGGEVIDISRIGEFTQEQGVVLDGIYGTGFRPPLPQNVSELLSAVSQTLPNFTWIAVDCPSGLDCTTGEVGSGTIKAAETLCLEAVKQGMLAYSAHPFLGALVCIDLEIAKHLSIDENAGDLVVNRDFVRSILPMRHDISHKGSYGKTLVIGGCVTYPGAPVLAGRGAYAVGNGLVQVAVPASIYQNALNSTPELTWVILEDAGGIISEIAAETVLPFTLGSNSVVIGPGLGRGETTKRFLQNLLLLQNRSDAPGTGFPGINKPRTSSKPSAEWPAVVIDADGIYLLAQNPAWFEKMNAPAVLTPHPGEMALLTGMSIEEIQNNRFETARKFASKWGQTVVLKGPLTVIAGEDGRIAIIPIATSSLAKAGTGDVLAGMIGGLLAQGLGGWEAAAAGAWLHAQAGLEARRIIGCDESVLAGDVIRSIPLVYTSL